MYRLPEKLNLFLPETEPGTPAETAELELERLLKRLGVSVLRKDRTDGCRIRIGNGPEMTSDRIRDDGFSTAVSSDGITLISLCGKGLLNAVYDLAERFGVRFLSPLPDGEYFPGKPDALPEGTVLRNPRFPHRGLFIASQVSGNCSMDDRTRFLAKLKCNAVCYHGDAESSGMLCRELGIRKESGGHGLSRLLDRSRFAQEPELFRMFQPEDFHGKRQPDANLCVSHPENRKIIADAFAEYLSSAEKDLYARHAWADDLPAGGWCLCSSCRSLSPEDQAMLGMRYLCRGAEQAHSGVRVPVLAYHDTLFPGRNVPPDKRMFLLWAPRERCYAHALNDPACPRNRVHWEALTQWMKCFQDIDDAHTFEYYQDQLLFSGIHPYLPGIIAADMKAYQEAGIESHMTLQVASHDLGPDYNGLFFAWAHWETAPSGDVFAKFLTKGNPVWTRLLQEMEHIFSPAMRMCDYDMKTYLDYRWLPEIDTPFARESARIYRETAGKLSSCAEMLASVQEPDPVLRNLFSFERKRLLFEAAEFRTMHVQQSALCRMARARLTDDPAEAEEAVKLLKQNVKCAGEARERALEAGYPETCWHLRVRLPWEIREAEQKIRLFSKF